MDEFRTPVRILLLTLVLLFPCAVLPKGPERHTIPRPAGPRLWGATPAAGSARNSKATVAPNLRRTSFLTQHSYAIWTDYYSCLSRQFDLNPLYFRRFYYNTEPLVTPELLKITLKAPLRSSSEMLDSIDELEAIFENNQSGSLLDRQAVLEKCEKIRELAKAIRNNQTISYIDVGKGKDLYSPKSRAIQPEDFQRLREMAVDLNRQLKNLYSSTSTATVSVDSFNEPSLESLAKGIEKMCKAIENSSKRM
jgi:hypothetical protein